QLQQSVLTYKDAGGAEILAWAYLRGRMFPKALNNFKYAYQHTGNPDMLRGLVLAQASSGHVKEADALLEKYRETFEKNNYMIDILPVLVEQAFSIKAYKKSINLLRELKDVRPLTVGDMSILAWSHYHLKQFEDAVAVFEPLYVLKSDSEVARGLYYSLLRLGDDDKMSALADKFGGDFEDFVERDRATSFYHKHQYLAAHARRDVYSEVLRNIDEPYARLSYMQKNSPANSAGAGPAFPRMNLQKIILEGRDVFSGVHELSARVEFLKLDGSERNLVAGAEVGTITGGAYVIPKLATVHKGVEWSLGYRYEDQGNLYAELGQLNVATAIQKADWKFRLGYARSFDERSFQVEAYRQPLRETLLSYVGMTDPYLGVEKWGQVTRNGANLSLYQALPYQFSANLSLAAETRRGYNVKANSYYSAYIGLPYDLATDNFEHLSVGPYARIEHSTIDQNHFTIGHGGYYSPQYLRDFGLSVDVMTKARKAWIVSLSGSVGRQAVRTSASPKLPLNAINKATYAATSKQESHYQVDVAAVVALTDYVRVSAEYKASRSWAPQTVNASPAFSDQAFMVSLTVHFEPRGQQLLQDDIPSYRLQPLY
ncbi:MAG: cellulose synthase subunit BcsC-related outer membrane protein, partial [Mariprofundaceae bacterium]